MLGEAQAWRRLALTTDPEQRYKLAPFLQLESEAKVRLRPLLAGMGLDLVEDEGLKEAAHELAERFAAGPVAPSSLVIPAQAGLQGRLASGKAAGNAR